MLGRKSTNAVPVATVKATKRAAMYAGVSCSAIKKIRQENKARKEKTPG
jgi:hypothetical protein